MDELTAIQYDGTFDLATGRSRREMHWRNREVQWSAFLTKIAQTHRTAESYSEYISAKKVRQDEIKDVGGFVGGFLTNGRRKSETVLHRQLVALDIDAGSLDIWEDYTLLYGTAAAMYSTHKHCPESPRLRLIIPLDRPVDSNEYVAIARRIAGELGINAFDNTTYEPARIMYWPSTSKDGDYVFHYHDAKWLSADDILATYKDWRDASEWPVSDRAGEVLRREMKKQGDPLEKAGLLGAFCRTYGIEEAIEKYLSDTYEPCAIKNRYTYKEGSTFAGLVVYDNKFAYSHHGTDPCSGKLCNAFDLVRLHLFHLKDEDARDGTPVNKLPSFVAMMDLAADDKAVRKQLSNERLQEAAADFKSIEGGEDNNSSEWMSNLEIDRKGNILGTINNYEMILKNAFKGAFRYNEFKNLMEVCRQLPWRKKNDYSQWKDSDDSGLRAYIEKHFETVSRNNLMDAVANVYAENAYHPVRDYLKSLQWDGIERLETLLIDYLGSEDSAYVRSVTRKVLTAAVARIMSPGVKFDYVLTLIGKQGIGKSTLLKKLGREWFSDNFHAVQGKDAIEQIQGVWIMEIGELAGLKKAEVEAIKSYISTQEDRCRLAYARRVEAFPRQCVFCGTTNDRNFLTDYTGNRRFWPVDVGKTKPAKNLFAGLDKKEVDQIWAEAVQLFKQGEPLYLERELEEYAQGKQTEHTEKDDRTGIIQNYLDTLLPENWDDMSLFQRRNFLQGDELSAEGTVKRKRMCVAEIWCELFGKPQVEMTKHNTKDLHRIMQNMDNWKPIATGGGVARFKIYGRQRGYLRVEK
jgi:predicted P-loop ATPase